jgi:hypothetical protein
LQPEIGRASMGLSLWEPECDPKHLKGIQILYP